MSMTSLTVDKKGVAVASGGERKDVGEWIARPDHPLLNNVVLDILFENMKAKELKESRLVCKKWNLLTIPSARPKFQIKIYGNQNQLGEENSEPYKRDTRRIDQFVHVFSKNSFGIPFDTFSLGSFETTDGAGKEFLKICGETVKGIGFDPYSITKEIFMIEDLSEVLKSSPQLTSLYLPAHMNSKSGDAVKLFPEHSKPILAHLKSFSLSCHFPEERKKCCPTFIEELLEVAPNISDISTHDHSHGIEGTDYSAEDVLVAIEKLGRESSIESLSFISVTKEHIEMMERMAEKPNGLKIKSLYMHGGGRSSEERNSAEVQTATMFKDTLEDLQLAETVFYSFFQFPTMPRLKSLTIAISEDFYTRGYDLNKIFPTLETLSLACWQDEHLIFEEFITESEPCPTVKSLEISTVYLSLNSFDQILNVFPKLTKLELDIKEPDGIEILMRIWTHMIQLETLEIGFRDPMMEIESLDSVFTGIPFQRLQEIQHVMNSQNLGGMTPQLRSETISNMKNQHCQFPSIGNLKNLESMELIVDTEGDGNGTDLTDLTLYLGLYFMPHLKHVTFKDTKFTEAGMDILKVDNNVEVKRCQWM